MLGWSIWLDFLTTIHNLSHILLLGNEKQTAQLEEFESVLSPISSSHTNSALHNPCWQIQESYEVDLLSAFFILICLSSEFISRQRNKRAKLRQTTSVKLPDSMWLLYFLVCMLCRKWDGQNASLFLSVSSLLRCGAIFISLCENYDFPEAFKHNKQLAVELSASVLSVFAESFYG